MRGFSIGGFKINPLRYHPESGRVEMLERVSLQVDYAPGQSRFEPTPEFASIVARMIINPEDVIFGDGLLSPVDSNDVKYLIITEGFLADEFEPLADWYTLSGWPAEIVSMGDIVYNYPEETDQLSLKRCIEDYVENKNTMFVLLGGDDDIVPDQNCWAQVNNETDNTMPTDLFFACLDQQFDWNWDGDDRIGEPIDGMDLYPEVIISRAPVRRATEAENFVNKTLNYIINQPTSDFLDPMLLSGVELWNTWNGHSDSDWRAEAMWGNYIEPNWDGNHSRVRYYDTETDFGGPSFDVTTQNTIDLISDGYHYIFMSTHGSQRLWSMESGGSFNSSSALLLTNEDEQGIIYTIACLSNAFDSEGGNYRDPCLSEGFIRNGNGGAVGYQGCSRYGWGYSNQSPNHGPSYQYADEFYMYLFWGDTHWMMPHEFPYRMGSVAASHKASKVPECSDGVMRWLNYGLNSIGDPAMDLYTEEPMVMEADYDTLLALGESDFNMHGLAHGSRVCLWKGNEVYTIGATYTDSLSLPINITSVGEMYVTITAHNYLPVIDTVQVIHEGPYVIYDHHVINDSLGNENGIINEGETILLSLCLQNGGPDDALSVNGILSTSDSFVVITDSTQSYGDIEGYGGTALEENAFSFDVSEDIPDEHEVEFTVTATDEDENTWTSSFTLTAHVITGIDDIPASLPNTMTLHQNYPNPFNAHTQVVFELPEEGHVKLSIYNMLGQEIETILDGNLQSGRHTVNWDAGSYSSGVYFYRLSTHEGSIAKRMTLIK
ncbi:MAG: T9SS type A sorting domain-containing protein [candidate division Zixibacteria bacterium]|nr:T9SS type A sorting domain-containing protein [candidate division Zixibacteria bacterium]